MKPRLLDLFCGAGGCARGYQRAGFYVVGVDNRLQPRYAGDEFYEADALAVMDFLLASPENEWRGYRLADFDAIHASPPCQGYLGEHFRVTPSGHVRKDHPRLIDLVREQLRAASVLRSACVPYVIENIPSARKHLNHPVQLCGSSFGLAVRRHRLFESNAPIMALPCAHHLQREAKYPTQYRPKDGQTPLACVMQVYGNGKGAMHWPAGMGIDWMRREELAEAIPPAYTEHIGGYLLAEVNAQARAVA